MTLRAALSSLLFALVTAAPALAQTTSSTGSLTLMSRPVGASFRIVGDQVVVGRTPVTLDRGFAGRYRVSGSEIGYERWSRSLVLDGVTADTLWMTLRQKGALRAGARSLILPGWGQRYDEHPARGMVFLIAEIAAGAGLGVAELRYRDRVDAFEAADAAYRAAQTPAGADAAFAARQSAADRAEDTYQLRQVLLGAAVTIWGLSVIEAAAFVPRPVGTILLGAGPGGSNDARRGLPAGRPRFAMILARMEF